MKGSRPVIVGSIVVAALAAVGLSRGDGAPPLAPDAVDPLEKVAKELAKNGRTDELDETLDLLRRAGLDAAPFEKFAEGCRRDAARQKKPATTVPAAARDLKKLADSLSLQVAAKISPQREELARLILRIDDQSEAAQLALGREKVDGTWLDAAARARRARRAKIDAAIASCRLLDVPLVVEPSKHPVLVAAKSRSPSVVRAAGITVHSVWPAEKIARVVRQTARTLALANFLATDVIAFPPVPERAFVFFDDTADYKAAAARAKADGTLDPRLTDIYENLDAVFIRSDFVGYKFLEADLAATVVGDLLSKVRFKGSDSTGDAQPFLVAGFTNWCCLALLGARLPTYLIEQQNGADAAGGRTAGMSEEERQRRAALLLLSEAGLAGGRAWLQYLAERREDPPLQATLVDQVGKIQGEELLKATFWFELAAEEGAVVPLIDALPAVTSGRTPRALVEAAGHASMEELEARWHEWFVPARRGLAARLAAPVGGETMSAADQQLLTELGKLRRRSGVRETRLSFDAETSAACRKHARYLAKNPEQAARWPDAHEEYPDHPGFDPEGAWAGAHSVIFSGAKDARTALSGWMGTFYHRLPLLEPGLVRIGVACEQSIVVLDSGTFVRPRTVPDQVMPTGSKGNPTWWGVVWPPVDGTDVPTRFEPELPEPVPGEDCSRLGYPITFQLQERYMRRTQLELELHVGNGHGALVPCHYSTPSAPTNPKLAPDDTWCLIPKAALQPGATYTVTGHLQIALDDPIEDNVEWSFRCGSK